MKETVEGKAEIRLRSLVDAVGFMAITAEDEVFVRPRHFWRRYAVPTRKFGVGDAVRDWQAAPEEEIVAVYDDTSPDAPPRPIDSIGRLDLVFWSFRTNLKNRLMFGKLPEESGLQWHEYRYIARDRLASRHLISPW